MSINRTRELVEKPGCGIAIGAVLILVMVIGFIFSGQGGLEAVNQTNPGEVIAEVGSVQVTDQQVLVAAQNSGFPAASDPYMEAVRTQFGLQRSIETAAEMALAQDKGIKLSDEDLLKGVEQSIDQQIEVMKMQLGVDPANADSEFKNRFEMTPAEMKADFMAKAEQAIENEEQRKLIAADVIGPHLRQAIGNSIQPKDEEVLKGNERLVLQPIQFDAGSAEASRAQAEKALAEIKGGLSYEAAMDRYSKYVVAPNAKKSTAVEEMSRLDLEGIPLYGELVDAKAGYISKVIMRGPTAFIYKVKSVKPVAKAEYDKDKARYRDSFLAAKVRNQLTKELEPYKEKIQWQNEGYRLLYEQGLIATKEGLNDAQRLEEQKKLLLAADELIKGGADDFSIEPAMYARHLALEGYWNGAPEAAKKDVAEIRLAVYKDLAEQGASVQTLIDLVQMLIDRKDKEAGRYLAEAAATNQSLDQGAAEMHKKIEEMIPKAKAAGLMTADQESETRETIKRWRQEKLAEEANQRRLEEEEKKRIAEEQKRMEEEKKKAPATTGGTAPATTTGGVLPPATTGTVPPVPTTATTG